MQKNCGFQGVQNPLKSTPKNYYRIVTPLYINGQAIYSNQVWAYPPLKAYVSFL